MSVEHYRGSVHSRDYTPTAQVNAGDIVVIGGLAHAAHHDIAPNQKGDLAVPSGGPAYIVTKAAGVDIADGAEVNVDAATATITAAGTQFFGYAEGAAPASALTAIVRLSLKSA